MKLVINGSPASEVLPKPLELSRDTATRAKSMVFKEDDPRMSPIWDHFNHLRGLGEVRATHFIRKLVEGKGEI